MLFPLHYALAEVRVQLGVRVSVSFLQSIERHLGDRLVGHVARNRAAIEAREAPTPKVGIAHQCPVRGAHPTTAILSMDAG